MSCATSCGVMVAHPVARRLCLEGTDARSVRDLDLSVLSFVFQVFKIRVSLSSHVAHSCVAVPGAAAVPRQLSSAISSLNVISVRLGFQAYWRHGTVIVSISCRRIILSFGPSTFQPAGHDILRPRHHHHARPTSPNRDTFRDLILPLSRFYVPN